MHVSALIRIHCASKAHGLSGNDMLLDKVPHSVYITLYQAERRSLILEDKQMDSNED